MKNLVLALTLAMTSVAFGQGADAPKSDAGAKAPAFKAHVLSVPELDKALADPDKVLVIADGRIVEQGHHETLLSPGGAYAALFSRDVELTSGTRSTEPW